MARYRNRTIMNIDKDHDMENDAAYLTVAALAVTGAITWIKNGLSSNTKAQQALALRVAENHMTKEETKEMVKLMQATIHLKVDNLSTQVKSVDTKLDTLLNRG